MANAVTYHLDVIIMNINLFKWVISGHFLFIFVLLKRFTQ